MTRTPPSAPDHGVVAPGLPLARVGGRWVLAGRTGQLPVTDPQTASELDALAWALTAADLAVAASTCGRTTP